METKPQNALSTGSAIRPTKVVTAIRARVDYDRLDFLTDPAAQSALGALVATWLTGASRNAGVGLLWLPNARGDIRLSETAPDAFGRALSLPAASTIGSLARYLHQHGGPKLDLGAHAQACRQSLNTELCALRDRRRKTVRGRADRYQLHLAEKFAEHWGFTAAHYAERESWESMTRRVSEQICDNQ